MATLDITVTHTGSGRLIAHRRLLLDDDLARHFVEQLHKLLAGVDRPVRVRQSTPTADTTVLTIDLGREPPPRPASPTFEQSYRRAGPGGRRALPPG